MPTFDPAQLIARVRAALRLQHYSPRTERAYTQWITRFVAFHRGADPVVLPPDAIRDYLNHLADTGVSASTQNQALAALQFLHSHVYRHPLEGLGPFVHAQRPQRIPVVLTQPEVASLLAHLRGPTLLMASLLYGAGLRLLECCTLRVKDLDLDRHELRIRDTKGRRDRVAPLPNALRAPIAAHLEQTRALHQADLRVGAGYIALPTALDRKYPNLARAWPWQWVFPATRTHVDSATGQVRRHHLQRPSSSAPSTSPPSSPTSPSTSRPTPCATPSPPTSSRPATTSAPSRSSSAIATSPPP